MPVRYPVASGLSLCLLATCAGAAVVAQSLPDVAVAIRGSDKPWFPTAIGGRTIAGNYSVVKGDNRPEQGAFTWDGTRLRTYPSVLHSGGDNQPVSSLTAVNADGVAAGVSSLSQMTSSGGEEIGIALRFAGGKTAVIDKDGPGLSIGGAYAVDPRGDLVGNTATGLGFYLDAKLDVSNVAGLTTARLGAATVPGAINAHGYVAGTSTTLRTFGNRFDANPFEPHVFLSRAGALAEPGQDLGRVPNCHAPMVVGLSDDGTVVGTCPAVSASQRATSWQWKGAFGVLPALPGDDATEVSAISPDGIAVGSSSHGDRQTAVLWRGGHVAKVSSLADQPPGDVFLNARGISAEHWIVVDGLHGDQGLSFLVVPQADADAAARIAAIPVAPTPIPIGAPTPAYDSVTTGGPAPTAAPLELMHVAAKPLAPLHARFSGASPIDIGTPGAHPVVDDGRLFYLAVPTAVEAFDARGSLVWKHLLAGATALGMTGGMVVVTTPQAIVGLDAASGAVRWSTRVDFANPPSLVAGDGFAGVSGERLQIYEAKTGRHIATTKFGCQLLVEAAGAFGCQQGNLDYSFTTRFVDGATGRDLLSLPGHPDSFSAIGSSLFEFSSDVIAVHPRTKTYDALAFPGPGDVNRRVLFDGTSVVVDDDGIGRRFRLDADPRSQHVTPFPAGDALYFAAGDGFEAHFAAGNGPLTIVSFDSAGMPSAVVYDGVRGVPDGNVLIAHGFAFAQTAKGIAVVHLKAKRVLGIATCACHVLYGVNVIGRTAILGCTNDVPTPNASRVTAIDLGED